MRNTRQCEFLLYRQAKNVQPKQTQIKRNSKVQPAMLQETISWGREMSVVACIWCLQRAGILVLARLVLPVAPRLVRQDGDCTREAAGGGLACDGDVTFMGSGQGGDEDSVAACGFTWP